MYEGIVQDLIDELAKLPGVGPKGATRIAFHLLATDSADVTRLATVLAEVKDKIKFCRTCYNVAQDDLCRICADTRRDQSAICVVEEPKDVLAVEIILATDPNLEGEATATYLTRLISPLGIKVTRLASGLPVGGDLEYADEVTLGRAFEGRRQVSP